MLNEDLAYGYRMCALMSAGRLGRGDAEGCLCVKSKCQWWQDRLEECAIGTIAAGILAQIDVRYGLEYGRPPTGYRRDTA